MLLQVRECSDYFHVVGVTRFEPAASTSQTQKHRFFASFCVLFRAFSSETRAFSCRKVHNSHVVRSRRWSKMWSGHLQRLFEIFGNRIQMLSFEPDLNAVRMLNIN